jgi:hypothetical protein
MVTKYYRGPWNWSGSLERSGQRKKGVIKVIKSRRMRWERHIARMGDMRNVYKIVVGKPEGKIPLGRPNRTWDDNVRIDFREVE